MSNKYIIFVGMGFELVGIILAGVYLGQAIDQNLGTKGLALAGIPLMGLIGWIIHIVILTKKMDDQ